MGAPADLAAGRIFTPASPSRLVRFLDCPRSYRFAYHDRPMPALPPQRAHNSLGNSVHAALREWWELPRGERTPAGGATLLRQSWQDAGFRDAAHSLRWRERSAAEIARYLESVDADAVPRMIEGTLSMKTGAMVLSGRVDRLDDRDGELVVVDYKTGRTPCTEEDARTSLALALYAAAAWKRFGRPGLRVELHHIPSATVVSHVHTPASIARKIDEAQSILTETVAAGRSYEELGVSSPRFPPRPSALCPWCAFRAHCPEGQSVGPEKARWQALD